MVMSVQEVESHRALSLVVASVSHLGLVLTSSPDASLQPPALFGLADLHRKHLVIC